MKTAWKMPPIIKVYEALGAIGDGRVAIVDRTTARVTSSDGAKVYDVISSEDGREISSNDNASYWQGYLGYPAIATLVMRELLKMPPGVAEMLAGIPWKTINRRFGNDYEKTLGEVDRQLRTAGHQPQQIRLAAEAVLEELGEFAPLKGKRTRPARGNAG